MPQSEAAAGRGEGEGEGAGEALWGSEGTGEEGRGATGSTGV